MRRPPRIFAMTNHFTAFQGSHRLATGPLAEVALAVKRASDDADAPPILVFNDMTGRAIDFQVTFAGNKTVSFSGTADQPLTTCQGAAAGVFSGPQGGDIGGWQTTGIGGGSGGASGGGQSTAGSGTTASGSGASVRV